MKSNTNQFQFSEIANHFELDSHEEIKNLKVDSFYLLHGTISSADIVVVIYENSPLLSFYDMQGELIDVDHYLPDNYPDHDVVGTESVLKNLKNYNAKNAKKKVKFESMLLEVLEIGNNDLILGIKVHYGLEIGKQALDAIIDSDVSNSISSQHLIEEIISRFFSFEGFLDAIITNHQKTENGYVHITNNDNIIITPLNKRSGLAVIIETNNQNGELLPPNKWNIIRTKSESQLEKALVFRTEDVKSFFESLNYETNYSTDKYKLYIQPGLLQFDSLLDDTDNLLTINAVNSCFQILASDNNILIILSTNNEITIVNTHKSVVPKKWPRKIVVPKSSVWMRVDENLCCLFSQSADGVISCYDITATHPKLIGTIGQFDIGFEITQQGNLIVSSENGQKISVVETNVNDLQLGGGIDSFAVIFKNISHLFKGESLFTKTKYGKVISEEKIEEEKLPSALDVSRFDFETSIEHMLLTSGDDYDSLILLKNKISIARLNIAEELTAEAEKAGFILVGQRLKSAISNIVGPIETKVSIMLNKARSEDIIESVRRFKSEIKDQNNTDGYREMLNSIRQYDEELRLIKHDVKDEIISEFKLIQEEMNALFVNQITNDKNTLNRFISGEIDQIEKAIINTHDYRQLEILLSTHPACLELMSLLKQPFVLQSVGKNKKFSPATIQSRLHSKIEERKLALQEALKKQEAKKNAAKLQLAEMINQSIIFFVKNHSGGFSDQELSTNASHESIHSDIRKLEREYNDVRLAQELRRNLTRKILDRNRDDLEKMVAFEGKYAYIQNDPDLFVDLESTKLTVPTWDIQLTEKKGFEGVFTISYIRDTDKEIHKISTDKNLLSGKSFEINEEEYRSFKAKYEWYIEPRFSYQLLIASWEIYNGRAKVEDYPQFTKDDCDSVSATTKIEAKSLRCALEKKYKEHQERTRERYVPKIGFDFIDETPYFQGKLNEFMIKAKLQKLSSSGIILLSGPPSTGKSAFLKFASSIMNREYFEHASDKWQTKNSLVTAIKFGEYGPYSIPAGFTKAITTPHSLINIEEIKEWPEALRKSLNPFFAGSKIFTAPDGTKYNIGENILMCAAANLGSMYRKDDEPFTADFWSRIEVVEYNYAPEIIDQDYYDTLIAGKTSNLVTIQDLVRQYFHYFDAPKDPSAKAAFYAKQFLDFILLPKADEEVKKSNLANYINEYFIKNKNVKGQVFNPEEAIKIAFKRIKDFRSFDAKEFYILYDHFCNQGKLHGNRLIKLKTGDVEKYEQLKTLFLIIRNLEGCLRELRHLFYTSAGQTEIEGTNREFIKCVHLLGLLGKV